MSGLLTQEDIVDLPANKLRLAQHQQLTDGEHGNLFQEVRPARLACERVQMGPVLNVSSGVSKKSDKLEAAVSALDQGRIGLNRRAQPLPF